MRCFITFHSSSAYPSFILKHYSRYAFIFFLKNKGESGQYIMSLLEYINNQRGSYPKSIRTDNALEFFANSLNAFLADRGISHQSSCAYTPEQNGVVERMNQTIANSGYAMLESSGLPHKYWNLAYDTAVYLRNRSPTSSLPNVSTPYEAWFGSKPNVAHLRVFGEAACALVPSQLRKKLEPKSELRYFVGYS